MTRTEGETAILLDIMYRGPVETSAKLFERMHETGKSGCSAIEFATTFGNLIEEGYLVHDADEDIWHLTPKGVRRCAVPHSLLAAAKTARDEALYTAKASPDRIARNAAIGAVGSRIGEAIEGAYPALVRLAVESKDAGEAIERGLDNVADAIHGLADAIRGNPTCADGDEEEKGQS